jgi:mRNA interferase MazF
MGRTMRPSWRRRWRVLLKPGADPVPRRTAVNLYSVESVSVAVLVDRLGRLADTRMREICGALEVAVDCPS